MAHPPHAFLPLCGAENYMRKVSPFPIPLSAPPATNPCTLAHPLLNSPTHPPTHTSTGHARVQLPANRQPRRPLWDCHLPFLVPTTGTYKIIHCSAVDGADPPRSPLLLFISQPTDPPTHLPPSTQGLCKATTFDQNYTIPYTFNQTSPIPFSFCDIAFTLGPRDAVVWLGCTPPPAAYFSIRSYLAFRFSPSGTHPPTHLLVNINEKIPAHPPTHSPYLVWFPAAELGDPTNLLTLNSSGK